MVAIPGPIPFTHNPAQAIAGIIDMSTREGTKYYDRAVKPLMGEERFEALQEGSCPFSILDVCWKLPVSLSILKGHAIADWTLGINCWRSAYIKKNMLKKEYVQKLNKIGLKWSVHQQQGDSEETWQSSNNLNGTMQHPKIIMSP